MVSMEAAFFDYICPFLGCLIASTLFAAPVNDLRKALREQTLGPLNPNPWCILTGNCLGWCSYAYYTNDPFILASNLPGLVLSFWLNMGAAKLQYLAQVEAMTRGLNNQRSNAVTRAISQEGYKESLVYSPQDILFLRVIVLWSSVLVCVGWFGYFQGYESQAVGVMVNINMIFFYAAPLETMKTVIESKCSDSIHGPTITLNCVNAAFWFLYGTARRDIVVWGPNSLGLCLGISQVILCWWYPKSNGLRTRGEMEFRPVSTLDDDPDGSHSLRTNDAADATSHQNGSDSTACTDDSGVKPSVFVRKGGNGLGEAVANDDHPANNATTTRTVATSFVLAVSSSKHSSTKTTKSYCGCRQKYRKISCLQLSLAIILLKMCLASEMTSTQHEMDVLVTMSTNITVFSCFVDSEDIVDIESCCEGIQHAWHAIPHQQDDATTNISKDNCRLHLAKVPRIAIAEKVATAFYSWSVPSSLHSLVSKKGAIQFLHRADRNSIQILEDSVSPYHLISLDDKPQQTLMPLASSSVLDANGGMHRLFHHSLPLVSGFSTYYLYFVVPQGMFIDLDDPLEASSGMTAIPQQSSNAKSSIDLQRMPTKQSVASVHLHATNVCDIEQPAFVSGQHVLVWEITTTRVEDFPLDFATKLHLRYPSPSNNLHQWVDLPKPILFGLSSASVPDFEKTLQSDVAEGHLMMLEPVWVAAGNDRDHDWIMYATIASCLLGVAWMLQDISRNSLWDDA
jgi:solute carrier family 50 (sugar transporter)